MGAERFIVKVTGRTAAEAFAKAREEALYEHGHRGYTGTIAEKNAFDVIEPEPLTVEELATIHAERLMEAEDPRVNDKWGPAGCIVVVPPANAVSEGVYIFFGWASS